MHISIQPMYPFFYHSKVALRLPQKKVDFVLRIELAVKRNLEVQTTQLKFY